MSTRTSFRRRLFAGLGVTALTALMVVGTAGVASAVDPLPPPSTITETTANLHVTKYLQPDTPGSEATGLPQTLTGYTPLNGVTFTAEQVPNVDLTTNAGWVAAADYTVTTARTAINVAVSSVTVHSQTTGTTGEADFTGLPIGLYLVTETSFPANITPSAPFLVTLPMTHPTELDTWMYDVYVYPKNSTTAADKTVTDAAAVKLGDTITFTVTTDIPHVVNQGATTGNNGAIDEYEIVDDLDGKVDYTSAAVTVIDMTSPNVAPTLVAGTDYTITPTVATANGPTVTITFTETGRNVLANLWQANLNATVQVVITGSVNAVGEIANTATLYPNSFSTGVATNSVTTKWGGITVEKQDAANHATKLAGATFQVYVTGGSTTPPDITAPSSDGPITIGTASSWTTNPSGILTIDGLRYSNWANNAAVADGAAGYHQYWLVETVAPTGYELIPNPIAFTVTGPSSQATLTVDNIKHNAGLPLPLTGGSGTAALTIGGVALLVMAGAGYLVAVRRRRAEG